MTPTTTDVLGERPRLLGACPLVILSLLLSTPAVVRGDDYQTYIEFHSAVEGPHAAQSGVSKLWRSGTRYARIESPVDPSTEVEGASIISEPDIYIVDLNSKRGRHIVDPDPKGAVHIPLYVGKSTATMLEAGQELRFFKSNHAIRVSDADLDGIQCARFKLQLGNQKLTLFIDLEKRAPKRIRVETPKGAYSIWYDAYVRKEPFDAALYRLPDDFELVTGPPQEVKEREIDTPFARAKRSEDIFIAIDAGAQRSLSGHLCQERPIVLYLFEPNGPFGPESVKHLKRLYARYKDSRLCLVPFLASGQGAPASRFGFPVYELQMLYGHRDNPLELLKEVTQNTVPAALVITPSGGASDMSIHDLKDFDLMSQRIELAFADKAPDAEQAEADPKEKIEDMAEVQKRVEGELASPELEELALEIKAEQFAAADKRISEWRKQRTRGTNGSWILKGAYDNFVNPLATDAQIKEGMALLQKWIRANTASPTPRVMLARLWINYAWMGRGSATVDKLSENQKQLFEERLQRAHQILTQAKELKEQCPELYAEMIRLGMGEGWSRDELNATFQQGRKIAPDYQYMFVNMVRALLPKWGGEPGEWEDFLGRNVPQGEAGDEVYARVAQIFKDESDFAPEGKKIFINSALSWDRVRRGSKYIYKKYPAKKMNANYFAFMACAAGDKKTANEFFGLIGRDYSQVVWGNQIAFNEARRWARAAPAGRRPASPPDSSQEE